MNIKNLKIVMIFSNIPPNQAEFSATISIPFVSQYMKLKKVLWNLTGFADADTYYNLADDNQIFSIKSSLVNYDSLTIFTTNINDIVNDGQNPVVELKVMQSYTEHMSILFKLNNQIINGIYSFQISTPKSIYTSY